MSKKEKINNISNIPLFYNPLILLRLGSLYLLSVLSDNISISESQLKQIIKVSLQYHRFVSISSNYSQKYKQGFNVIPETYT